MIIRIEDIKEVATKVLSAVDSNDLSKVTETLELYVKDRMLYLNVTNREYYAQVKLNLGEDIDFHATVNANLFLKLIAQITTETVELTTTDTTLVVKGNGTYKLPLIFDGEELLKLPEITIGNPTSSFDINGEILKSVLTYNSKELNKGTAIKPVQKFYYMDEKGAITFTSNSACVNNFTLSNPIKVLLPQRVVKLFRLFDEKAVHFTLGFDAISEEIIQTKVQFMSDNITITAILQCDDTLLSCVPVDAIRNRATSVYPFSIAVNKEALIQTINRMLLFSSGKEVAKPYGTFKFSKDSVIIEDARKENVETLYYANEIEGECDYTAMFDLTDIKATLENCAEQYLTMNFGNSQSSVIARGNVYNVIAEVRVD